MTGCELNAPHIGYRSAGLWRPIHASTVVSLALVFCLCVVYPVTALAQTGSVTIPDDYSWKDFRGMVVIDSANGPVVSRSRTSEKPGDLITAVNGVPVNTASEFMLAMRMAESSDTISVTTTPAGEPKSAAERFSNFGFRDTVGGVIITKSVVPTDVGKYVVSINNVDTCSAREAQSELTKALAGKASAGKDFTFTMMKRPTLCKRLDKSSGSEFDQAAADQELEEIEANGRAALDSALGGLNNTMQQITDRNLQRRSEKAQSTTRDTRDQNMTTVPPVYAGVPSPQPVRQPSLPSSSYSPLPQQRVAAQPSASSASSNRPEPVSRPAPLRQFNVRMSNRLNQGYSVWDVDITNPNGRALQCQVSVVGSMYAPAAPGRLGAPQGLTNKIEQGDYFSPGATKRYSVVANGSPAWSVSGCN